MGVLRIASKLQCVSLCVLFCVEWECSGPTDVIIKNRRMPVRMQTGGHVSHVQS